MFRPVLRRWSRVSAGKRRGAYVFGGLCAGGLAAYETERVRRTVAFWYSVGPWVLEWKVMEALHASGAWDAGELRAKKEAFHERVAPLCHELCVEMRGSYVKAGQVISTSMVGIVPDAYVRALEPLQNGLPPRSLAEIGSVFAAETGTALEETFSFFDPTPLGCASVAQAHRATLKADGRDVVVKVQYPEVGALTRVDLSNVITAVTLMNADGLPAARAAVDAHLAELDFRREASNLKRVRENVRSAFPTVAIPEPQKGASIVLQLECLSDHKGVKKEASALRKTLKRDDHLGPNRTSL